eukprot:scaffold262320_cov31-Tisochrysis_lutea.AAC.4
MAFGIRIEGRWVAVIECLPVADSPEGAARDEEGDSVGVSEEDRILEQVEAGVGAVEEALGEGALGFAGLGVGANPPTKEEDDEDNEYKAANAAADDEAELPRLNNEESLLRLHPKGVVAGGDEGVDAGAVEPDEAAVKVGWRRVEHHAVGDGVVDKVAIVARNEHASVTGVCVGAACDLGKTVPCRHVGIRLDHLDEVGAVSHIPPVACILQRVGVRASPLEVHAVALPYRKLARAEVVRDRRVDLHRVTAPPLDVEIVDGRALALARTGLASDEERVRAVLKCVAHL